MRPQSIHHALSETKIVNAPAFWTDRHAIGKDPGLSIEWNQTAFKQADENRIARVAVKHACYIGPAPVDRGVDRRLGRNRPFSRDAFAGEVYGANVFWIGQYAGESGIYEKAFRFRNSHAQMTRAGEDSFTGHDLQTFHQSPLEILDASAASILSTVEELSTGLRCCAFAQHTFWICDYPPPPEVIGLLTRGYIHVNVPLFDGLNVIDSSRALL